MKKFNLISRIKSKNLAFLSLIFIFMLLLIQSAILLFVGSSSSEGLSQMDIIFRTTLSSLFGFFISSTYVEKTKKDEKNNEKISIGFTQSAEEKNSLAMKNEENGNKVKQEESSGEINFLENKRVYNNLQVVFLSVVCLFCLIIMMVVRNFSHMIADETYALVTLSMYRDFISSSVGAIIGLSRGVANKDKQ